MNCHLAQCGKKWKMSIKSNFVLNSFIWSQIRQISKIFEKISHPVVCMTRNAFSPVTPQGMNRFPSVFFLKTGIDSSYFFWLADPTQTPFLDAQKRILNWKIDFWGWCPGFFSTFFFFKMFSIGSITLITNSKYTQYLYFFEILTI